MRTEEKLLIKVQETSLVDRLHQCGVMIGNMCADGRPPKMSIPIRWEDEDFYITTTIADAISRLESLNKELAELKKRRCWTCIHSTEMLTGFYCRAAHNNGFEEIVTKWGNLCGCEQWRAKK